VADFLSNEWFEGVNRNLANAGPAPLDEGVAHFRVVLNFLDAPADAPRAMTFTIRTDGASLQAGDHPTADAAVKLSYEDALALTTGRFDSASALREGSVKVHGDINAIVNLLSWLQSAHPTAEI
jgi:alkyl sulfatase BDS1-like metallo-beta-lactamase superfamily hydrolase